VTRVNCVPVQLLVRQHLIAEWREAPRIFGLVRSALARGEDAGTAFSLSPRAYTLGAGHCRFFYTRLGWMVDRCAALNEEMRARGHIAECRTLPEWTAEIPRQWWGQWEPTPACMALNAERINLRLEGMGLHGSKLVLSDNGYECISKRTLISSGA